MEMNRRSLILGAGASLLAAPAIVRAASLMKVKAFRIINPIPFIDNIAAIANMPTRLLLGVHEFRIGDCVTFGDFKLNVSQFIVTNTTDEAIYLK